jgi:hypothetical protein
MMCLDDESTQFTLVTIIFVDHSLFTFNTIKHATHNAIWDTLQLFPRLSIMIKVKATLVCWGKIQLEESKILLRVHSLMQCFLIDEDVKKTNNCFGRRSRSSRSITWISKVYAMQQSHQWMCFTDWTHGIFKSFLKEWFHVQFLIFKIQNFPHKQIFFTLFFSF